MGGLQNNLINRSKDISGDAVVYLEKKDVAFANTVHAFLKKNKLWAYPEYELELLIKNGTYLSPIIIHGVIPDSELPKFLEDSDLKKMVIPYDIAHTINVGIDDQVRLISPSHVDTMLGDIPRSLSVKVGDILSTDVPEVDAAHAWVRLPLIQNLIRKREINRLRIHGKTDYSEITSLLKNEFGDDVRLKIWEEENSTLVWALQLETTVMVFLFVAMTMLVSLCITSGLMIFFDKVKLDLASFWIMGASKMKLEKASALFINIVSLLAVSSGLIVGIIFLLLLDKFGANIMPDVFVDRKIPVFISLRGVLVSFFVPYVMALLFTLFTLGQFQKDNSFLDHVRSIG
jgi:lipoprotein-releasing system permease protein